jgi:hypothetical protein
MRQALAHGQLESPHLGRKRDQGREEHSPGKK